MTAIVGLVHEGEVWIGADSASTWNDSITPMVRPKVFRLGAMLIGAEGTSRLNQIIEYHIEVPQYDGDPHAYLVREFVPALRQALDEHGYLRTGEEEISGNESMFGALLIALEGRLFEIGSGFQMEESIRGYICLGSGAQWCEGSLYSTLGGRPDERIALALKATAEHCVSVIAPFHIEKL